jgi:hypothetical protein
LMSPPQRGNVLMTLATDNAHYQERLSYPFSEMPPFR